MTLVHPDRWNTTVSTRKSGVVIHDSETGDGSYAALIAVMTRPGERLTADGHYYGSSYHAVARNDLAATYDEVLDAHHAPFSAPPTNGTWWQFCIPGRASQTRADWLDQPSRSGIRAAAKYVVAKAKADGFLLERRTPAELAGGKGGYCGHVDVSAAWHRSDHTDPGSYFPWDLLALDIAELSSPSPGLPQTPPDPAAPLEDDDMASALKRYRDRRYKNIWLIPHKLHLSGEADAAYAQDGVPLIEGQHEQMLDDLLHACGLTRADLVPV